MDIFALQNGSDIRGVAVDGYQDEKVNLTEDIAEKIALGFAEFLEKDKNLSTPTIALGTDSRISREKLSNAVCKALLGKGCKVIFCGIASTPAMYEATKKDMLNCDASIMLTASHLPYNRNGMKFFTKDGGTSKDDIGKILTYAQDIVHINSVDKCAQCADLISMYSEKLVRKVQSETACLQPLKGLKIIVDAGNGSGGFFVDKVLKTLGADTSGSVYLNPDGMFPNHVPNPEDRTVMENFSKLVKKEHADLGIVFDTDVDRSALVDEEANPVSRNRLIALISDIILKEHPNSYIVTDSVTSDSLSEFIQKRSGIHHRFKRGYNNVINESKRLNEEGKPSYIGIETSGHCALRENDFLDDGAYLIVKILIKYVKLRKNNLYLKDLLADYRDPLESLELRGKFTTDDFRAHGDKLLTDFKRYIEKTDGYSLYTPNYEGVRVHCDKQQGWVLLRMSLHDPVLAINIESDKKGGSGEIKEFVMKFLETYKIKF